MALLPQFTNWMLTHGKQYASPIEHAYRQEIFQQNLVRIQAHNAKNATWTMGVNQFADLTAEEFRSRYSSRYHAKPQHKIRATKALRQTLPTSIDWVAVGAVTPVKNQEQCGSCWAFSTTGATEGAWFLAKRELVSLSEQQLVDCSTAQGNQGCNGGMMDYGFQYIIANNGITTEGAYPYTATGPNTCQASGKPVAAILSGYQDVPANSDASLMAAIAKQPVSVAIEADQGAFQFYSGGVMTASCGTNLDHGVLAVGYGTDPSGGDYYKVKNSWGTTWGEAGYIRLGRGPSFDPSGQCGILMAASYPVV
jgi:C1A family cysteine protease